MAREAGVTIDLAIYGGAALSMEYNMRDSTRDVDAVVRGNPTFVRNASKTIADEMGWTDSWLNDGVKGFLSSKDTTSLRAFKDFEQISDSSGGLRIYTPTPEYIFAMKCMAMRSQSDGGTSDYSDIEKLAEILDIKSPQEAIDIVESFYPASMITPKTLFGVQEIMERILANTTHNNPAPGMGAE